MQIKFIVKLYLDVYYSFMFKCRASLRAEVVSIEDYNQMIKSGGAKSSWVIESSAPVVDLFDREVNIDQRCRFIVGGLAKVYSRTPGASAMMSWGKVEDSCNPW